MKSSSLRALFLTVYELQNCSIFQVVPSLSLSSLPTHRWWSVLPGGPGALMQGKVLPPPLVTCPADSSRHGPWLLLWLSAQEMAELCVHSLFLCCTLETLSGSKVSPGSKSPQGSRLGRPFRAHHFCFSFLRDHCALFASDVQWLEGHCFYIFPLLGLGKQIQSLLPILAQSRILIFPFRFSLM